MSRILGWLILVAGVGFAVWQGTQGGVSSIVLGLAVLLVTLVVLIGIGWSGSRKSAKPRGKPAKR